MHTGRYYAAAGKALVGARDHNAGEAVPANIRRQLLHGKLPAADMRVYRLSVSERHRGLLADPADYRWDATSGVPVGALWTPWRWQVEQASAHLEPADFIPAVGTELISQRAADALADVLDGAVELLSIEVDGRPAGYALNVTRVIDALDVDQSELDLYPDGGVMFIDRHVFRPEALTPETFFRVVQSPQARTFVTDVVRERAEAAGLTGLCLAPVWSSEEGPLDGAAVIEVGARPAAGPEAADGDSLRAVHIVPVSGECDEAMALAYRRGIEPNEAANGVWLTARGADGRERETEEIEAELHTAAYCEALLEELRATADREQALSALASVRERLQAGTFPH